MRKTLFALASVLILSSAASAQTLDRQVDSAGARGPAALPGSTGTPADIVTVPLGTAGAVAGGALNAAGTVVTAPIGGAKMINGDYQHPNENSAAPGGVSETGKKSGVAENPKGIGQ